MVDHSPWSRRFWCRYDAHQRLSARLVVLSATGNLRAWFGLFVLGISAYATFKGLLAENRVHLQQTGTWDLPTESIFALFPEIDTLLIGVATIVIGFFALRRGLSRSALSEVFLIGALVAGAWWAGDLRC